MDIYTKYNRKNIQDRHIDTLIGLSKGITCDGKVNQAEAEALYGWLIQSRQASDNPIIVNLLEKVSSFLEDGFLDSEESEELLNLLSKISGESSELGKLAKTSNLPIDDPVPAIIFENKLFLFTGTCAFGTRKQCKDATKALGGLNANGVTENLNYLVLGTYVTDRWMHENYGRNIEKAVVYRDRGVALKIITEKQWADTGNID
jgi:NAD-dependent DNA ligase